MESLKFGTKLTTSTAKKGMLVMLKGHGTRVLGLEKTIALIDDIMIGDCYPCVIKVVWSADGLDRNSIFAMRATELRYFGIAKEKNKHCPSPIFEWRPKVAPRELMG